MLICSCHSERSRFSGGTKNLGNFTAHPERIRFSPKSAERSRRAI
jgi:hypothetical protein